MIDCLSTTGKGCNASKIKSVCVVCVLRVFELLCKRKKIITL